MSDLRTELREVLTDWQEGRRNCQSVQVWARGASARESDEYVQTIMQRLRGLGEYLITADDVPLYLAGLQLETEQGLAYLEAASQNFDVKARATDLKDDPFYGPHTRAILRELR
jgi:hypothetical protein